MHANPTCVILQNRNHGILGDAFFFGRVLLQQALAATKPRIANFFSDTSRAKGFCKIQLVVFIHPVTFLTGIFYNAFGGQFVVGSNRETVGNVANTRCDSFGNPMFARRL